MVKIKIHRGTSQIGGTITEIYTENTHIFIDFGSQLNVDPEESTDNDMIYMIKHAECDAVLFSHYHGDHVGLLENIPKEDIRGRKIRLCMGLEARKVMIRIYRQLIKDNRESPKNIMARKKINDILCDRALWDNYSNKMTMMVGDFEITPIRVDHSAYDAYMFVIEAEGKRIVHTGDFRTHGRLGSRVFDDVKEVLVEKKTDILITEGTMMERISEKVRTEEELEKDILKEISKPENKYAFVLCSSTNMESLASFDRAAYALGRPFIMNSYVYSQIKGFRSAAGISDDRFNFKASHDFRPVEQKCIPYRGKMMTQTEYMREKGFIMLIGTSDAYKKRMEIFREQDPLLIYSMWSGYIDSKRDTYIPAYGNLVKEWRCNTELHTSGHATVDDIENMIRIVKPESGIIPVHTTRKEMFKRLNIDEVNVIEMNDGEEVIV